MSKILYFLRVEKAKHVIGFIPNKTQKMTIVGTFESIFLLFGYPVSVLNLHHFHTFSIIVVNLLSSSSTLKLPFWSIVYIDAVELIYWLTNVLCPMLLPFASICKYVFKKKWAKIIFLWPYWTKTSKQSVERKVFKLKMIDNSLFINLHQIIHRIDQCHYLYEPEYIVYCVW